VEGDNALETVAAILTRNVGQKGIVCRYGGEEFTVLLPRYDTKMAFDLAEKIRMDIEKTFFSMNDVTQRFLTASIGVCTYPYAAPNTVKVVCYYGCQASRPPSVTESTDWENPQSLDKIMKALGAKPILWPYKTDCCGASLMLSRPDMGSRLVGKLFDMARRVGAQAMVVSCQMCQSNLDMYQEKIEKDWGRPIALPVPYFTELIGLALGIEEATSWMSRHFADPRPALRAARI